MTPLEHNSVASLTAAMKKGMKRLGGRFIPLTLIVCFAIRLCCKRGDEDRAAELVQQTMLRVVRHIRRFDDESAFWGWLTCLSKCAAADAGRKRVRRMRYMEQLAHMSERRRNHDDRAMAQLENLEQCIETLNSQDRALIEGKYYARRSHVDLAQQFGISAKAIESKTGPDSRQTPQCNGFVSEGRM